MAQPPSAVGLGITAEAAVPQEITLAPALSRSIGRGSKTASAWSTEDENDAHGTRAAIRWSFHDSPMRR